MSLVNVSDGTKSVSLYVDDDAGLSMDTLRSAFHDATNLRNPSHKTEMILLRIRDGKIYNPDGWNSTVVYPVYYDSRPQTPAEQDYTQDFALVKPFLFSINEETGYKSCAAALTQHCLVTYRHGTHSGYVKDVTVLNFTSIDSPQTSYKATVIYISEKQDYVILKTKEAVTSHDVPIQQCEIMKKFVVCGFGQAFKEITFVYGNVYTTVPFTLASQSTSRVFGPFVYGTAKTSRGDSGAACFGKSGLMALNLGITTMPKTFHDEAISEASIFSPNNYMVPARTILEKIAELQPRKPTTKPHHVIQIGGEEIGF